MLALSYFDTPSMPFRHATRCSPPLFQRRAFAFACCAPSLLSQMRERS